jgi:hypothetical protein
VKLWYPVVYSTLGLTCALALWLAFAPAASIEAPHAPLDQWASAHFIYEARRPDIAVQTLRGYADGEGVLGERAFVWRSILLAGMSRACVQLATAYHAGGRENAAQASSFYLRLRDYRNCASEYSLELAELLSQHEARLAHTSNVPLDFALPAVGADPTSNLEEIAGGYLPSPAARERIHQDQFMSSILAEVKTATGTSQPDALKRLFSTLPAHAPAALYGLAMAISLDEATVIFGPGELKDSAKEQLLHMRALRSLRPALLSNDPIVRNAAERLKHKIINPATSGSQMQMASVQF